MPRISQGRELVRVLGLESIVDELVSGGMKDSRAIARKMMEDPNIETRLRGKKIYPTDVDNYLKETNTAVVEQRRSAVVNSPEVQQRAAALKNGVDKLLLLMDKSSFIAETVIRDFDTERVKYMNQTPERGPSGAMVLLYEYPHKMVTSLEKASRIIKSTVDTVKGDEAVKQILRAGTVNVHTGYSEEQLFEEIVAVCIKLGHTRADALKAWAESKAAPGPIDVASEVVPEEP